MNKSCVCCNKKNAFPICSTCANNPFLVEKARDLLARQENKYFKSLYGKGFAEIQDLNTRPFWDDKLEADQYLNSTDGMTQDRVKITYKFIPKTSKKVFDIGLGHGFIEEVINKKNPRIELFGNDISASAIKNIKKRFKGNFKVESIYDMKQNPHFFDVVFTLEVLEHIPPSKIFDVLKDIRAMIKPNGYFILSVPMNEGLDHMDSNPSGHVRTYTRNLISAELKVAGFKVLRFKELYAFRTLYTFKKLMAKVFPQRWEPNNIVILAQSI